MATHRISILNTATRPDDSGSISHVPYNLKTTNSQWKHFIFVFPKTATRVGIHGQFAVPQNYAGSPKLVIVWTANNTAGNTVWDFDLRAVGGDDTESLDQAGVQESVSGTDAAPGAVHRRLELAINLTAANFVAGKTVQFFLPRDGTDAANTMNAEAFLIDAFFEYSDQ